MNEWGVEVDADVAFEDRVALLMQAVNAGFASENEFRLRLGELAADAVLAAYLRGSGLRTTELNDEDRAVIEANQVQARRSAHALAADVARGRYKGADFAEIQSLIAETGSAGAAMGGAGEEEGSANDEPNDRTQALLARIALWGGSLLAMGSVGMLARRDDPLLRWLRGSTHQPCSDCLRLDGQIKRASEWKALGLHPQGRMLECGGWHCKCHFEVIEG